MFQFLQICYCVSQILQEDYLCIFPASVSGKLKQILFVNLKFDKSIWQQKWDSIYFILLCYVFDGGNVIKGVPEKSPQWCQVTSVRYLNKCTKCTVKNSPTRCRVSKNVTYGCHGSQLINVQSKMMVCVKNGQMGDIWALAWTGPLMQIV